MSKIRQLFREYSPFISAIFATIALIILIISASQNTEKHEDPFLLGFELERANRIFSYSTPIPLGENQIEISIYSLSDNEVTFFKNPDSTFFSYPIHHKKYDLSWNIAKWQYPKNETSLIDLFSPALSEKSLRKGIEEEMLKTLIYKLEYAEQSLIGDPLCAAYYRFHEPDKFDCLLLIIDLEKRIFLKIKRVNITRSFN